jgi:hypothetical protein
VTLKGLLFANYKPNLLEYLYNKLFIGKELILINARCLMPRTTTFLVLLNILLANAPYLTFCQWARTDYMDGGGAIRCFAVSDSDLYAAGVGGVFLTTNDGDTWTNVGPKISLNSIESLLIRKQPASDSVITHLYVGSLSSGVILSTNRGRDWTPLNEGLSDKIVRGLALDDSTIFVAMLHSLWQMRDIDSNWTLVYEFPEQVQINCIAVTKMNDGRQIIVGTTGGVFMFVDTKGEWKPVSLGLSEMKINSFAANDTTILVGTDHGLQAITVSSSAWRSLIPPTAGVEVHAIFSLDSTIIVGTSGGIVISTNYGVEWDVFQDEQPESIVFAFAANDGFLFAATGFAGVCRRELTEILDHNK